MRDIWQAVVWKARTSFQQTASAGFPKWRLIQLSLSFTFAYYFISCCCILPKNAHPCVTLSRNPFRGQYCSLREK